MGVQSTRKSALLSAAKKAKLRNNPSRVRFAEGVVINGTTLPLVSSSYPIFFPPSSSCSAHFRFFFNPPPLTEPIAEPGRSLPAAHAQRDESLPRERADEIVQVRLGHHRLRRPQLAPAKARLQIDGQLFALRRARQEHPQKQVDAARSGRISRLGTFRPVFPMK